MGKSARLLVYLPGLSHNYLWVSHISGARRFRLAAGRPVSRNFLKKHRAAVMRQRSVCPRADPPWAYRHELLSVRYPVGGVSGTQLSGRVLR